MFRRFDAFSIAGLLITATACIVVIILVVAIALQPHAVPK